MLLQRYLRMNCLFVILENVSVGFEHIFESSGFLDQCKTSARPVEKGFWRLSTQWGKEVVLEKQTIFAQLTKTFRTNHSLLYEDGRLHASFFFLAFFFFKWKQWSFFLSDKNRGHDLVATWSTQKKITQDPLLKVGGHTTAAVHFNALPLASPLKWQAANANWMWDALPTRREQLQEQLQGYGSWERLAHQHSPPAALPAHRLHARGAAAASTGGGGDGVEMPGMKSHAPPPCHLHTVCEIPSNSSSGPKLFLVQKGCTTMVWPKPTLQYFGLLVGSVERHITLVDLQRTIWGTRLLESLAVWGHWHFC